MITSLHQFFNLEHYHSEVVASASKARISDAPSHWLIVRLVVALQADNRADASAVLQRLDAEERGGHDLFLIKTAHLIIAIESANLPACRSALEDWLTARAAFPGNFIDHVVDAPELADIVTKADREAMVLPDTKRPIITKADRALIADFAAGREQAIIENLEWLRQMNVVDTVEAIAKSYRITFANHHLREITICSNKGWPDIIIAVDEAGVIIGSFLSH